MSTNKAPQTSTAVSRKKQLFSDKINNEPQFIIAKQIHPAVGA